MIRGQFNCIITCKIHEEASTIEAFLGAHNINAYIKQYQGQTVMYSIHGLSFKDMALIQNFLTSKV